MNIKNEESFSEQYAIISYSHADAEAVKSELKMYDDNSICYWFDEQMTGGKGYDTQFFDMLDNKNCKGIIYFISDPFLLSDPCANEMKYFKEKYGTENQDKFCLFVIPAGYPYNDADVIYDKIDRYVTERNDAETRKKLRYLNGHIDLFLELNRNGKEIFATLGNANSYVKTYCEEGQLFNNAGIIFGYKHVNNEIFGYFPQRQTRKIGASEIEKDSKKRQFDGEPSYYAPVEWFVIKDNEQSQTLLSKELLFSIDYLSLKYPFKQDDRTIEQHIKDIFFEYFKNDNDKRKIDKIRFLTEAELQALLRRNQADMKKDILMPVATHFAQMSSKKDSFAFWLAGDIEDARRVDSGTEGLSDQKAGVELYYARIVAEITK